MSIYTEIIIHLMSSIALVFSIYCAIRIRQLEKRINIIEANFTFIKDILIEIDIEKCIKEKLSEINSSDNIDEKEIANYVKNLVDKHKKMSK